MVVIIHVSDMVFIQPLSRYLGLGRLRWWWAFQPTKQSVVWGCGLVSMPMKILVFGARCSHRAHRSFWFSQLPPCFSLSNVSISLEGRPPPSYLFILWGCDEYWKSPGFVTARSWDSVFSYQLSHFFGGGGTSFINFLEAPFPHLESAGSKLFLHTEWT